MKKENNNGFVYIILNFIVELLKYINLVELFKLIAGLFTKNKQTKIKYKNVAIDLFIFFKWGLLLWAFYLPHKLIITSVVFYLLFVNLYVYFYYHFWNDRAVYQKSNTIRIKRRFINLIQSISFTVVGFAYMYLIPFSEHFKWTDAMGGFLQSLNFSFTNTFIGSSSIIAITNTGLFLQLSQYCFSFLFLAILLSFTFNYNLEDSK